MPITLEDALRLQPGEEVLVQGNPFTVASIAAGNGTVTVTLQHKAWDAASDQATFFTERHLHLIDLKPATGDEGPAVDGEPTGRKKKR